MPTKTGYEDYGIKEAGQAVESAIGAIGGIFQDRYNKKQYDDFLAGPSKDYQDQMQQAQDLMLDEDNADAPQQALHIVKNATTAFMDNATRYKSNPYIMGKAQQVWDGHMSFIKDEFSARFQAAKNERAEAASARNAELQPLRKQGMEAKIELTKAQAGKASREPVRKEDKGVLQFLSGDPQQLAAIPDPDQRVSAARTNVESRINSPRDERQREQINLGIKDELRSIAMQRVSEKAGRNEIRSPYKDEKGNIHGGDVWDPNNPEHIKDAESMIDPTLPREQFILRTIQGESRMTGVDPVVADRKYGVLVDPGRATPNNPVTRPLKEDELGKVLFGGGASWDKQQVIVTDAKGQPILDALGRPKRRSVTNVKEAAQILPEKYEDLTGIVGDSVKSVVSILKEEMASGESVTMEDIQKQIQRAGVQNVAAILGGANMATRDLPEGIRRNRTDARVMIDAASKKYAEQIAITLGLKVEKKAEIAEKPPKKGFTILDSEIIKKYTPFGSAAKRIDQATGLLKGKE